MSKASKRTSTPTVAPRVFVPPPDPKKWRTIVLESYPDVSKLDVWGNPCNLRRDLHLFVDYVRSREVKRATRGNQLGKTDARRLAKLMSDEQAAEEIEKEGFSTWIYTVDTLARQLGFVHYDTKGSYAGYSSSEPSFPNNVIQFDAARYTEFVAMSLARQEQTLFDTLIDSYPGSEFFQQSPVGRLTPFSGWGSATGVIPKLDFRAIRRFLFQLLAECQSGVWYSVAALIQSLKVTEPYFLIPKAPAYQSEYDKKKGRYGNFHESKSYWGYEIEIADDAPDAFERVEGRYVERFLEAIPLLAGYVDVAYATGNYTDIYPTRNYLRAFRIHDSFLRFMQGTLGEPLVTVQPNYEIHVESPFYPAKVLTQLAPLTELVRADRVTVLKLDKRKVTTALAHDPTLDVVKLLARLSGRALPQNIDMELTEWAGHSENFVLYDGFGLFEGDGETLSIADAFTVETITPKLRIVRSPAALFARLEEAEAIPLRITHLEKALQALPPEATTLFRTKAKAPKAVKPKKQALTLLRKALVTLHFPNQSALADLHQALVSARCPVEIDRGNLTLTYASQYEAQVTAVFKAVADRYAIKIEEIETKP